MNKMYRIASKDKTTTLNGKISQADKDFIKSNAVKFGLSQSDFITFACRNFVKTGSIWHQKCLSCKNLESRDRAGLIAQNYKVSRNDKCMICGETESIITTKSIT